MDKQFIWHLIEKHVHISAVYKIIIIKKKTNFKIIKIIKYLYNI